MTGDISEQGFYFHYGPTASNGKSTYLNTLQGVLGPYAKRAHVSTFLKGHQKRNARNDLARLAGARLVTCSEAEKGERLAEALIKDVTGDDPQTARFLYTNEFEYTAQYKLHLALNHLPKIEDPGHAHVEADQRRALAGEDSARETHQGVL